MGQTQVETSLNWESSDNSITEKTQSQMLSWKQSFIWHCETRY
jgi:hypothetical protein